MDKLQVGVEQPLAVFPQPPVFLRSPKTALDDPALESTQCALAIAILGHMPNQSGHRPNCGRTKMGSPVPYG